jgi:hypothetical protein
MHDQATTILLQLVCSDSDGDRFIVISWFDHIGHLHISVSSRAEA